MAENERRAVFLRRVPEEMYRQLQAEADAAERTVPAEIIYRLRDSLRRQKREHAAA